jgi:hypothetical protein
LIYYRKGTNFIAYDTKGGKTINATDGTPRTDENGDVMYFNEDGSIAYDTVGGELMGLDADKDGYVDYVSLSKEEIENVTENAKALQGLIENGDFSVFEAYGAEYSDRDDVWNSYPNGIFLNSAQSYSLDYLNGLSTQLMGAEIGEVILYHSDSAYHLVMKYPLAESAWSDKANADWFGSFEQEVMDSMIRTLCEPYEDQIVIDQDVLAGATSMKDIGVNWNY